jgi:uncharacterized protein DUF3592
VFGTRVIAGIGAGLLASLMLVVEVPRMWQLSREGRRTHAQITSVYSCGRRYLFRDSCADYAFEAGGDRLTGRNRTFFDRMRVGQRLDLWYLPDDPRIRALGDPGELLWRDALIGLGALAIFGWLGVRVARTVTEREETTP